MRSAPFALALCLALLSVDPTTAKTERGTTARATFKKLHPCPSTDQPVGPCPGWIVDHIVPLCADGADHPDNMQWQTAEAARAKDNDERTRCRHLRGRNAREILAPHSNQ